MSAADGSALVLPWCAGVVVGDVAGVVPGGDVPHRGDATVAALT